MTKPVSSRVSDLAEHFLVAPMMIVARIAIVAMCVLTLADIAGRHLFGLPVPGVIELAELALVWSAFTGIAAAFWTGAHVSVELIELLVPRKVMVFIFLANTLIMLTLMTWLAWLAVVEFRDTLDFGDRTTDLSLPYTWYWAAVIVGYVASVPILAVRLIIRWQSRSAE